jgi:hypothetical protein
LRHCTDPPPEIFGAEGHDEEGTAIQALVYDVLDKTRDSIDAQDSVTNLVDK